MKIYHIDNEVLKSIGNGDLIIDCGGNIGEFSRAVLEKVPKTKNIEIIIFEPSEREYKIALRNFEFFPNVFVKNLALSNKSEKQKFYINSINADSSLVKPASYHEETSVEAVSLDDYFHKKRSRVVVLKIEAEGFEPEIVYGGKNFLNSVEFVSVDGGPERGLSRVTTYETVDKILKKRFKLIKSNMNRFVFLYKKKKKTIF